MTTSKNTKKLSRFATAALALDEDFSQLEQIGKQLDKLSIESDHGFDQAKKLLVKFSETGERVGVGVQELAKSLEEARINAETTAQKVATRALEIQARHEQSTQMMTRFHTLGEMVSKVSTAVGQLRKPAGAKLTADERSLLTERLPELNNNLGVLFDEAKKIKEEAHGANMKTLERDAHALGQTLHSVRGKLTVFAERIAGEDSKASRLN